MVLKELYKYKVSKASVKAMFNIFKRDKKEETETQALEVVEAVDIKTKTGIFSRLKNGLSKTRNNFTSGLANIVLGKKQIDAQLLEDIETQLLMADVGVATTTKIIEHLTNRVSRKEINDPEALINALKQELEAILTPVAKLLQITDEKPYVILVIGINGSGKTTTIGKLAKHFQQDNKKVMLAAGDTFRAAAIEQLQVWGERNNVPVVSQQEGSDSASVAYDALQSATAKGYDVLLTDTAGRLHTQGHLMEELKKVKRVISKQTQAAPHETLLVLDAGIGQNALVQAKTFMQAVNVTGIALTKLDGTAKGGIIFAIADTLGIPIRYIGVGEGVDDLRAFDAPSFVEALFATEQPMEPTAQG